eukprot:scaffold135697_cov34-Tisochrysis_lutea.AAC.3
MPHVELVSHSHEKATEQRPCACECHLPRDGRDESGGEEEWEECGVELDEVLVRSLRAHVRLDLLVAQIELLDLDVSWVESGRMDPRLDTLPDDRQEKQELLKGEHARCDAKHVAVLRDHRQSERGRARLGLGHPLLAFSSPHSLA